MATIDERLRYLDALAGHLAEAGLSADVQRTGEPCLLVSSPALSGLTETIFCTVAGDETLWFGWQWRKPIARATDPARAAVIIAQVLRPVKGSQ